MADTITKTTSSKSLDENEDPKQQQKQEKEEKTSVANLPKSAEAQIMTKLATNLTQSYQLVKQRQQKYNELSSKLSESSTKLLPALDDWQEVCTNKNKLKRKKKLSASLTSVSDSVNQEKRTRIEGIQLNCRGRLPLQEVAPQSAPVTPTHCCVSTVQRLEKLTTKPPLPPAGKRDEQRAISSATNQTQTVNMVQPVKVPPPRLKRKLQENMQTIQKLNAQTEQLRLEINELKSNLTTERGAVRVLRAQNESESRKWKNEVKKLQHSVELLKKTTPTQALRKPHDALTGYAESLPGASTTASSSSLVNHEIQRLTNEILALKEAKHASEEKKMIICDADRRKAADIRELRDSYEIRLTQLTKSAKTEISRLLEEIKTKERNIGHLKKELQQSSRIPETTKSRNATNLKTNKKPTNQKTNKIQETNKKQQQQQHQKPEKKENINKTKKSEEIDTHIKKQDNNDNDTTNMVQDPNEMKQLKDLELINNSKNIQQQQEQNNDSNNFIHKTTKVFNTTHNTKLKIQAPTTEIEIQCNNSNNNNSNNNNENTMLNETQTHFECLLNNNNKHSNIKSALATTTTAATATHDKEHHSLPHDLLTERFIGTHNAAHEYRGKDHNSDSDSALSSAPPSISPQPPPSGMESADIWQTLRNYSTDIEKLQKDLELLQKENAELRQELQIAKEQIMESEKSALAAANNTKLQQLLERIRCLEEQEHQLQAESDELREQNELLEFRILELEDSSDKWSLQSNASPSCNSTSTSALVTQKDLWSCSKPNKEDPMAQLFGSRANSNNNNNSMDSQADLRFTSPQTQKHMEERLNTLSPCELNLIDHLHNDELRRRIMHMLQRLSLDKEEKQCLEQMLSFLQNLDVISHRSGPNSLNTSSSEEASSLDMVKSRISDYSSASSASSSSASSARFTVSSAASEPHSKSKSAAPAANPTSTPTTAPNLRIVATVLPYNSSGVYQHQAPTNTPADSPRKTRHAWQSNSLSESGVFVESDFLSDTSENNVCTQTDFDEAAQATVTATAKELTSELLKLEHATVTAAYLTSSPRTQSAPAYCDPKRLQYYKERLELLESKVLVYESSGDLQAKHLADRLQREIQLEKQVKDLRDRVDFLESENATLEEEKCEFEEAENDTRLRLQRLEVELEILSQRNIELEMSREALSAKYKDCRSECLILRDDLSVSETQIRHLEEDKQKAKENLEFLHSTLPLFMFYSTLVATSQLGQQALQTPRIIITPKHNMGNALFPLPDPRDDICNVRTASMGSFKCTDDMLGNSQSVDACVCQQRELDYLKEEVKILRHQIKELNSRHYEAMESADSHWVDLEKDYKEREENFRAKEQCLKQKINRLQDCLRDDARAANEKITQLEETEKELKSCLTRLSKEHRELSQEHKLLMNENQCYRDQTDKLKEAQQPLRDSLDSEKKRSKSLTEELNFMRKLQAESDSRNLAEIESMRNQLFEVKKEFLHIQVTNSELREEVATLESQMECLQKHERDSVDQIRCLKDEVRTKDEMCAKLEKRVERNEANSLAQELNGSPSKRLKREDVIDLKSATKGLDSALRNMKDCSLIIPSHKKFTCVARDVKKLADALLGGNTLTDDEVSPRLKNVTKDADAPVDAPVDVPVDAPVDASADTPLDDPPQIKTEPPDVIAEAEAEADVTIGLAIIPEYRIDLGLIPCSSFGSKKQIFEVPSEMRKIQDTRRPQENDKDKEKEKDKLQVNTEAKSTKKEQVLHMLDEESDDIAENLKRSKRICRRSMRKRIAKRTAMSLRARMRRIIMNAQQTHYFHDASDIEITRSEVLQRISYESFYSINDEPGAVQPGSVMMPVIQNSVVVEAKPECLKVDAWTDMDIHHNQDKETETQVLSREHSIQVNDDIYTERLLDVIPPVIREFFNLLQSSISQTSLHTRNFNEALRKRWDADEEFREGLDILQNFATYDLTRYNDETVSIENYENFVNAMSCLHVLEEIYKPIKIPVGISWLGFVC